MTTTRITEKAMLVRLSISQWTARKFDKGATKTVENTYGASDAGRFNKLLIAQDALSDIQTAVTEARTYHYTQTLPWKDEGTRILSAKNFLAYSEKMREFESRINKAADEIADAYPQLVEDARRRLNGLFKEADYPPINRIRDKYKFRVDIAPIPMAGDFRVELQSEETDRIKAEIEASTKTALQEAHKDLYTRLADTIGKMAERLQSPDAIFRDSLVQNVCDLINLIPKLDIMGDAELEKLRKDAEAKLCKIDPQTLRDNKGERAKVAEDAKGILDAMSALYGS